MLLLVDNVFVVVEPLLLLVLVPLFFGTSTFVVMPYALAVVVLALALFVLVLLLFGMVAFWHWCHHYCAIVFWCAPS